MSQSQTGGGNYHSITLVLKLHADIHSLLNALNKSQCRYLLTNFRKVKADICLLLYILPHISLCGLIRYLIKYKFATNNDSGVSQDVDIFLSSVLPCQRK